MNRSISKVPLRARRPWSVTTQSRRCNRRALQRRGVLSMELVIALPIFGILLMGLFEYTLLFSSRGDVVEACRAGCRKATLANVTDPTALARPESLHAQTLRSGTATPRTHPGRRRRTERVAHLDARCHLMRTARSPALVTTRAQGQLLAHGRALVSGQCSGEKNVVITAVTIMTAQIKPYSMPTVR